MEDSKEGNIPEDERECVSERERERMASRGNWRGGVCICVHICMMNRELEGTCRPNGRY